MKGILLGLANTAGVLKCAQSVCRKIYLIGYREWILTIQLIHVMICMVKPIDDEKTDKKKGRGASKLKMVSGQDKCKELERNEFGQPVGDNSVKYASFLGCMIKEFVPYTLDGCDYISEEMKDRMWSCLQFDCAILTNLRKRVKDLER
ncbi:uncharacterized protein [Primulina eburnea]|uniref:uncharacterized protein isoform X3 n=1 Tax=Primulina eburnea TaxID=1245227 RepID=UPI003C6C4A89